MKCLKCQYILILVAGNTKEQLEFHLKQQNLTGYGSVMKQNNSNGVL